MAKHDEDAAYGRPLLLAVGAGWQLSQFAGLREQYIIGRNFPNDPLRLPSGRRIGLRRKADSRIDAGPPRVVSGQQKIAEALPACGIDDFFQFLKIADP